jgi:hypothetical protein
MATQRTFAPSNQNSKLLASSKRTEVYFVPFGSTNDLGVARFSGRNGFYKGATPTFVQAQCLLCSMSELAEIGITMEGEEKIVMPGKRDDTRYDGSSYSTSITLKGNAIGTMKFILGMNPSDNEAVNWGRGDFDLCGGLIIHRYADNNDLKSSTFVKDVKVKVENVSGVANSGENQQMFTFYNESAENNVYTVFANGAVVPKFYASIFVQDANITNAAAPSGSIAIFQLDNVNNSVTTTPPQPIQFKASNTGYEQYLALLRVNRTLFIPSAAAVASAATYATGTITFGAAPADGTSILVVCAVDGNAYDMPLDHSNSGGNLLLSEDYMGML